MSDWNAKTIEDFRANEGKVGGTFEFGGSGRSAQFDMGQSVPGRVAERTKAAVLKTAIGPPGRIALQPTGPTPVGGRLGSSVAVVSRPGLSLAGLIDLTRAIYTTIEKQTINDTRLGAVAMPSRVPLMRRTSR